MVVTPATTIAMAAMPTTMAKTMGLRRYSQSSRQQTSEEDGCAFHRKLTGEKVALQRMARTNG
jgi:hypothetical protein